MKTPVIPLRLRVINSRHRKLVSNGDEWMELTRVMALTLTEVRKCPLRVVTDESAK